MSNPELTNIEYGDGRYLVRGVGQEFAEASTGTPQFELRVLVLSCVEPFNDSVPQFQRTLYMYLTEKARGRTLHDLHVLGYPGESLSGVDPDNAERFFSFTGREFELLCKGEPDLQGKRRERWSVPPVKRPLAKDKLREMDRQMARERQKANGPVTAAVAPPPSDGVTEEDVPF
jgi:hypothetical protein